jgi:hypothetical protein
LAAIGLDRLLNASWPALQIKAPDDETGSRPVAISLRWLLVVPLLAALVDARGFSSIWLTTSRLDSSVSNVVAALRTPDLQWVNPPFGEQYWVEPAVAGGLKLAIGTQGWFWNRRPEPEAVMEATRGAPPPGMTQKAVVDGFTISVAQPGREYAAVEHMAGGRTVCTARGTGGTIDVTCDAPQLGTLVVKENSWSGWSAKIDRQAAPLQPGQWLSVPLPAGSHTVQFRYRPWDVLLGIVFGVCGVALAVFAWLKDDEESGVTSAEGLALREGEG